MAESHDRDDDSEEPGLGPAPDVLGEARVRASVRERLFGSEDDSRASVADTLVAGQEVTSPSSLRQSGIDELEAVGRFRLLERIGRGGMGVVFAAYDPELDRKVAIKLLRPDVWDTAGIGDAQQRLVREAQAMAKLAHPNVIVVHEVGTVGDRVFVAMELIEGGTLSDWIKNRPPWREVIDVFVRAGRGLAAAHAAGVVHRDFKPDNVLIGDDGRVRVMDFGLARSIADPGSMEAERPPETTPAQDTLQSPLTQTGAIMGTPAYMSPEQYLGRASNEHTDQFAFCVSLYEGLYGRRPFRGKSLAALASRISRGMTGPLPDTEVPNWVAKVVMRGLALEPSDRWPTMDALLAALLDDPARHRRRVAAGVGVATLAAVAVAGVAYGSRDPTQSCDETDRSLVGVWDGGVREQVHAALLATGTTYAEKVFESTARLLDQHATTWVETATQSCVAAVQRGDEAEEQTARRQNCLDRHLHELAELTHALGEADRAMVNRAVEAAASLSDVTICQNPRHLDTWSVPADATAREQLTSARSGLASARALGALGKYGEALAAAKAAHAIATTLEHVPSEAESLFLMGKLHERSGDAEASERDLRRAVQRADVAGDDLTRVRALTYLVYVVGRVHERPDEAVTLAEQAGALLDAIDADPLLRANLLSNEGSVAKADKRLDDALAHHLAAHEIHEQHLGKNHPNTAMSLNNIGSVLNASQRHVDAQRYYEQALASYKNVLGEDHPHVGIVEGNLGNSLAMQGQFDDAVDHQRRALRIRRTAFGPEHPAVATTLFNLGKALTDGGTHEEAIQHLEAGLAIREKAVGKDHPTLTRWLLLIGEAQLARERIDEARVAFGRGLRVAEAAGDPPKMLAELRFYLAKTLVDTNRDRAKALAVMARDAFPEDHEFHAEIQAWLTESL